MEYKNPRIQGSSAIQDIGTNSYRIESKEWYLCMMHKIQPFHGVLESKDPSVKFKKQVLIHIGFYQKSDIYAWYLKFHLFMEY